MRNFIRTAILALGLGAALAAPVSAQILIDNENVRRIAPVGGGYGTVSTDKAILVRYVGGDAGGGEVAVAANGDLTFTVATVADTAFECPVSGALGGVIDVSDAACDTLGEVVDTINGNCTGCIKTRWRAVILDGLRSDSSNDTLATISATAADSLDGLALLWDGTVQHSLTYALTRYTSLKDYLDPISLKLNPDPFNVSLPQLLSVTMNFTGTGASTFETFCVEPLWDTNNKGSETVRTIYSAPGAATTVQNTPTLPTLGFMCSLGEKLVVRYKSATTFTAGTLAAYGIVYRW